MFSEWQFAQNAWTRAPLPGPSGKIHGWTATAAAPLGESGNVAMNIAAPMESESRCLFMIVSTRHFDDATLRTEATEKGV